jgi:Cu-Zn family superoxide dismutase
MFKARFTSILFAPVLLLGLLALAPAALAQTDGDYQLYTLPGNAVFPEGVAYDPVTGYFYVSSTSDGAIFRGNINGDSAEVWLPGGHDGHTFATGLKVDNQGRLYVSGGSTGLMSIYDTNTKALLAQFKTGATPTFVNDVALTPDGNAYFTDSNQPVLYRVAPAAGGQFTFENWLPFTGTVASYVQGFNINGITASEDGRYLIVVQSNVGKLHRITVATKEVRTIDVGNETFMNGDGIGLSGDYLHVLRNAVGLLVTVQMNADLTAGTVVQAWTSPAFMYPTTFAQAGSRLLVVNSQFNNRGEGRTPVLPFTVANVPAPFMQTMPVGMPVTGAGDMLPLYAALAAGLLLLLAGGALRYAQARRH